MYMYCVVFIATGVYNKMQTLCTLHERHMCSICTRSKAALSVKDNADTLEILFICFIDCSFLFFSFLQTYNYNVYFYHFEARVTWMPRSESNWPQLSRLVYIPQWQLRAIETNMVYEFMSALNKGRENTFWGAYKKLTLYH